MLTCVCVTRMCRHVLDLMLRYAATDLFSRVVSSMMRWAEQHALESFAYIAKEVPPALLPLPRSSLAPPVVELADRRGFGPVVRMMKVQAGLGAVELLMTFQQLKVCLLYAACRGVSNSTARVAAYSASAQFRQIRQPGLDQLIRWRPMQSLQLRPIKSREVHCALFEDSLQACATQPRNMKKYSMTRKLRAANRPG